MIIPRSMIGLFVALFTVASGLSVLQFISQPDPAPLRYEVPFKVLTPGVPVGGTLVLERTKCNATDQEIVTDGVSGYRRWNAVDNHAVGGGVVGMSASIGTWVPGCTTDVRSPILPSEVGPGWWRFEGTSTYIARGVSQRLLWYSEPFEVVQR